MIDIGDLSEIVEKSLLDQSNVSVFLIEDRKTVANPISIYKLNIDSRVAAAIKSIAKNYTNDLLELIEKEEIKSIPNYNPDHSQVIFQIDKESVAVEEFSTLTSFLSGEKTTEPFEEETVRENKLKAWAFRFEYVVDNMIRQIYFFQKFQASKMLGTKRLSIFQTGGEFTLLDSYLLTIDLSMDFLLHMDTIVVTKMFSFEKIFGYEDHYKSHATEFITNLRDNKIPDLHYQITFSDFESAITRIQKSTRIAHKLYSAKTNGYYKNIDFAKLADLNKRYDLELVLDTTDKQWEIDQDSNLLVMSQILNDDYSRSQLTEFEYLALQKERIKQ